jgi:hypothetical protein
MSYAVAVYHNTLQLFVSPVKTYKTIVNLVQVRCAEENKTWHCITVSAQQQILYSVPQKQSTNLDLLLLSRKMRFTPA